MAIDLIKLLVSIVFCQAAGGIGAIFNITAIPRWYSRLRKPRFNPPNWIFGPVWTFLYLLMGISFYLIWVSGVSLASLPPIVFLIQLALNILWSALFFGLKNPGLAFVEIVFLWLSIVALIVLFYPISHIAAYLLVPYLLWVGFASVLNFEIWRLNRKYLLLSKK